MNKYLPVFSLYTCLVSLALFQSLNNPATKYWVRSSLLWPIEHMVGPVWGQDCAVSLETIEIGDIFSILVKGVEEFMA